MVKNIAVIGSSGAIGSALVACLAAKFQNATLHAVSQQTAKHILPNITYHKIDYQDENSIANVAQETSDEWPLDIVFVATGILHEDDLQPEKSLRDLSTNNFSRLFQANTILPAMLLKHFLPKLNRHNKAVFACLSARVGSISDNKLGGWYAYRASKAALNMIIKNAAIETARRNQQAIIIGMHPGTVDSALSKPFQSNVAADSLFTADFSASKMLDVIESLTPDQSGKCFAWDGQEIDP